MIQFRFSRTEHRNRYLDCPLFFVEYTTKVEINNGMINLNRSERDSMILEIGDECCMDDKHQYYLDDH